MHTNALEELLRVAPTRDAAHNAKCCLHDLALDLDFNAIRILTFSLGSQLGYKLPPLSADFPSNLYELLSARILPPLLRVYAAGYCPRAFVLNSNLFEEQIGNETMLAAFGQLQILLKRSAVLQHEALKALVLLVHLSARETVFAAEFVSIASKIMTQCEIVKGNNANSELQFGRDLLLNATVESFKALVAHELGHLYQPSASCSLSVRIDPTHCNEFVRALTQVKQTAFQLGESPWMNEDPRLIRTDGGLTVEYTMHSHPGGVLNHISLSAYGAPLSLADAAVFLTLALSALGIRRSRATVAYSPRGIAHLAFLLSMRRYNRMMKRHASEIDVRAMKDYSEDSSRWLADPERLSRILPTEDALIATVLGEIGAKRYFGPVDVLGHISVCSQLTTDIDWSRHAEPDDLNKMLDLALYCGQPRLVKNLVDNEARSTIELGATGSSLLVMEREGTKSYLGPTVDDIFSIFQILWATGHSIDSGINDDGDTLLIAAARLGVESVRFLIDHGADVNACNHRGETALHVAAASYQADVVRALLAAGADPNQVAKDGMTPLIAAVGEGADDLAKLLLESGAVPTSETDAGYTALAFARTARMATALCAAGADVNAVAHNGESALMCAARWGGDTVVNSLLKAGADVNWTSDVGKTALHAAVHNPHRASRGRVVDQLIGRGIDVNADDNDGETALHVALRVYRDTVQGDLGDRIPLFSHDPVSARKETIFRAYCDRLDSLDADRVNVAPSARGLDDPHYNSAVARRFSDEWRDQSVFDEVSALLFFFEDFLDWDTNDILATRDPAILEQRFDQRLIEKMFKAGADIKSMTASEESLQQITEDLEPDDDVRSLIESAA